ncbi:MAG: T9SS type A sorting domain-containing protein [Crocinitomicaceae bacterium]
MKFALLPLAITLVSSTFAQNTIYWTDPVVIEESEDGQRPRISLLDDNSPVLMYSTYLLSGKNLYFSKWENNDFAQPVQMNDANLLTYDWGGAEIDTDGENVYVVFKEENVTTGRVYIRHSDDGGLTWGIKNQIEDAGGELAMYPAVKAYDGNRVMVTYMTHGTGGVNPQYIVKTSVDSAQTFSSATQVSAGYGDEACYCCPAAFAANDDYQVLAFRNDDNNIRDIKAAVSTDHGTSFPDYVSLDDHDWYLTACPSTGPEIELVNATLYATYMNKGEGDEMVYFVQDDLSDATPYEEKQVIATDSVDNVNHPALANIGDTVVVVWQQAENGETNLWYNFSFNGISDWDEANAAPVLDIANSQNYCDLAIGTDGSLHLVYRDEYENRVMYTRGYFSALSIDNNTAQNFEVYPNPANNEVVLKGITETSKVTVSTLTGELVLKMTGNQLNVQELPAGVYLIEVEGFETKRLIVE